MKRLAAALIGLTILCIDCRAQQAVEAATSDDVTLADLMSAMQVRHLKLGYAVNSFNWPLARYEAGLMRQSFVVAARKYPSGGGLALADLVKSISTPALDEIDKAIANRDEKKFFEEFKKLNDACNSCHQASHVGFIIIRTPTAQPFTNQSFAPREQK